jgi:hypothetical protein
MMLIYTFLAGLALACCKEPTPTPPPPATKKLEVVWKTLLVPNENSTFRTIAMTPILYGDEVIFNTEYTINGNPAPVLFLDTANGQIKRTWSGLSGGPYNRNIVAHEGDYLLFGELTTVDCLNLNTAATAWSSNVPLLFPDLYVSNGYVYRGFPFNPIGNQYNSCALMRTSVSTLAWDTVYSFTTTDDYKPSFTGYGSGILPNGDEVVVWKSWSRKLNTQQHRADIFAYNLTADSLMWRNTDLKDDANTIPLKVENSIVYGLIKREAIAIDLATGSTIWRQDFSDQNPTFPLFFAIDDFYISMNHMIIKGPSDELFYLAKTTGKVVKTVQDMPTNYDRYAYFEGKLFGAGTEISIIDIASGENLLKDYDHSEFESWNSGITIDPDRRVFYCHDGEYAYCIKIPDL